MPDDDAVKIEKPLGDEGEIRERLNALGISYDVPLQTLVDLATGQGNHLDIKLKAAAELAKIMRLMPEKNQKATVVEATGTVVKVILPDNGRDPEGDDDG